MKVQSPLIGNALRSALALDAAGGMPLEADSTIVPVAIVADVRELLTLTQIPVKAMGAIAPVAAQFSYAGLEWMANASPRPKRIILDAIHLNATATCNFLVGFSTGLAGAQVGLPRRNVGSLQSSNVAARVISATDAVAPATRIPLFMGELLLTLNQQFSLRFMEPLILDQENQFVVVGLETVNIGLSTMWEWREDRG